MPWYNSDTNTCSPEAFNPRDDDVTGISVFRAKHKTVEEAAQGPSKHGYYVARFNAGTLRAAGIEIRVDDPDDPGHAVLPDIRADTRDSNAVLEFKEKLATKLIVDVQGPFGLRH
ncbi:MAG: hypothetical protein HY288_06990 [Planctomycetia bacterium]|nr:hypothetical protein [Planctomycetia bacterium]